jgi:hypothetical protein
MEREARMAVDAWAMAAECARAVEASENPTRRAVLRALQKQWIELGEKERLLSEQEVLKEMEDLHALHVQVLGTQSSAKARVVGPSRDLTDPERQSAPPRPAHA